MRHVSGFDLEKSVEEFRRINEAIKMLQPKDKVFGRVRQRQLELQRFFAKIQPSLLRRVS